MGNRVASKERVTEFAEVFTGRREVNSVLDLVKQETERLDSCFPEPACPTGHFLAEISQCNIIKGAAQVQDLFSDSCERALLPKELKTHRPVHFSKIGATP
jgi:hypothetical protein